MARKRSRSRVKVLTKKRKGSKKKRKRKLKRRHKTDKHSHARRRHAKTRAHGHKHKMLREAQNTNALLTQFLKMGAGTEDAPYHYDKRHHTKDPEYRWSDARQQLEQLAQPCVAVPPSSLVLGDVFFLAFFFGFFPRFFLRRFTQAGSLGLDQAGMLFYFFGS